MASEILTILTTVFGLVGGASIISGILLRRIDKLEKKLDLREQDRVDEAVLTGQLLTSCERLTEANTDALRVLSGEELCEAELSSMRAARERLESFVVKKSAEYLHAR